MNKGQLGKKHWNWKGGVSYSYRRFSIKDRKKFLEAERKRKQIDFRKKRFKVLCEYGGNPPKCVCCGENHIEFLAIDHMNGNGNNHRKSLGGGGAFYKWLIKNNFPEGYRILCHNCNCSLGYYDYCPHKEKGNYFGTHKDKRFRG